MSFICYFSNNKPAIGTKRGSEISINSLNKNILIHDNNSKLVIRDK